MGTDEEYVLSVGVQGIWSLLPDRADPSLLKSLTCRRETGKSNSII